MKFLHITFSKSLFYIFLLLVSCQPGPDPKKSVEELTSDFFVDNVSLFKDKLSDFLKKAEKNSVSEKELQQLYCESKEQYKKIEFLVEYFFVSQAKEINGAPIPEVDAMDERVYPPKGLQVVEEFLFPEVLLGEELYYETRLTIGLASKLQSMASQQKLTKANIFRAIRYELFRITALGITGYDSPASLNSFPEAIAAIEGMEEVLGYFKFKGNDREKELVQAYINQLEEARKYIALTRSFDDFDRLTFITRHINPLSADLLSLQKRLNIPVEDYTLPIRSSAKTLFEEDVFQTEAFAPSYNKKTSEALVNLGRTLFFDPILSGNNKRSCASCHNPDKAFTDGLKKSLAFDFKGNIKRNSPTIINASLQRSMFMDGRSATLEDQIIDVLLEETEMHSSVELVAEKLSASEEYLNLFSKAFGEDIKEINRKHIFKALGNYVRSLTSLNSRFDQYMRGDESKMSLVEQKGFNLFMGKGKCATCHFIPLFNGTSPPPRYKVSEAEVLGTPNSPDTIDAKLDEDLGLYDFTGMDPHFAAFKTPTVRNIALTAPYMHNGVYQTLEEVMDFYNRGGGAGIGIELENQTLPPDPLNLSEEEIESIISFLHTLTDTTSLTSRPSSLPRFDNSEIDSRVIGGVY